MELTKRKCKPCEGGVPKLTSGEIHEFQQSLKDPWEVVDEMKIVKAFQFKDYPEVIGFVNKIADLSEEEGHHPVMHVFFNVLKVEIWTHAILGLSENDFILAAKIDELQ
jgi:4a-hydroxytetrahydrobiopterin dehydratase